MDRHLSFHLFSQLQGSLKEKRLYPRDSNLISLRWVRGGPGSNALKALGVIR